MLSSIFDWLRRDVEGTRWWQWMVLGFSIGISYRVVVGFIVGVVA